MKSKVFCIGMFKTGTSSLGRSFDILEYKTLHGPWGTTQLDMIHDPDYDTPDKWKYYWNRIKLETEKYDAFQDYPWMWCFEKCHEWYPDAKFIITVRDAVDVANSDANMWNTPLEELKSNGRYQKFIDRYNKHYKMVKEYFKDKNNLLEIKITEGEGWEKLSPFLGIEIPKINFPHANKGVYR